jgi:N-acetyl-anhydromuramyl-L-alanine amidase AmpD
MNMVGQSLTLSPDIIEQLRQASRKLHDTVPLLDKAESVGIDVSQLRQTHQEMSKQIAAYQQHFFGGTI